MKELQQAIDTLSKQNEKERTILHSLQQTLQEQQHKNDTTIRRFLHRGYPPSEIAEMFDLSLDEIDTIRTMDGYSIFPDEYLTQEELEQFHLVIKSLHLVTDYQLVGDHLVFPFINKVTDRYQTELNEFVESDNDPKIDGELSFGKFAIASRRNDIREYLIKRLTREVENHKRHLLLKSN